MTMGTETAVARQKIEEETTICLRMMREYKASRDFANLAIKNVLY